MDLTGKFRDSCKKVSAGHGGSCPWCAAVESRRARVAQRLSTRLQRFEDPVPERAGNEGRQNRVVDADKDRALAPLDEDYLRLVRSARDVGKLSVDRLEDLCALLARPVAPKHAP